MLDLDMYEFLRHWRCAALLQIQLCQGRWFMKKAQKSVLCSGSWKCCRPALALINMRGTAKLTLFLPARPGLPENN